MGRRLVHICCYILFGIILMQCIGYNILSEPKFLMRSLSLAGAVLLILAETRTSTHTVFDLPTLGGDKPKVKFIILSLRLNTGRVQRASGLWLAQSYFTEISSIQAKIRQTKAVANNGHKYPLNFEAKNAFRVIFNYLVELCLFLCSQVWSISQANQSR